MVFLHGKNVGESQHAALALVVVLTKFVGFFI